MHRRDVIHLTEFSVFCIYTTILDIKKLLLKGTECPFTQRQMSGGSAPFQLWLEHENVGWRNRNSNPLDPRAKIEFFILIISLKKFGQFSEIQY